MNSTIILSYNIGRFYLFQPRRHLPIHTKNKVFFDRKDLPYIQSVVQKIKPDIILFQELTCLEDAEFLAQKLGFSFFSFFKAQHLKSQNLGTGILYNDKHAQIQIENGNTSFQSLRLKNYVYTNIHLNPFSKYKRAEQIKNLISYIKKYPDLRHIVAGDFNVSKRKWRWLNKVDKVSYLSLTEILNDTTSWIISTHKFGYKYDYIFTSPGIAKQWISCINILHGNMDHYPVYGKVNLPD